MTPPPGLAQDTVGQDLSPSQDPESAARDPHVRAAMRRVASLPVTFLLTLYLLGTGRWGSYLGIPGAPFYISDILVALATLQMMMAVRAGRASPGALTRAPLALLLLLSLLIYSGLRLALGFEFPLVSLRDFAPYGYAAVALVAYLLPVREEARWRPIMYATFVAHLLWVAALPIFPGFPWQLPVLGSDATLLVARPDFDTTVLGLGAAFAIRDLLRQRGSRRWAETAALVTFAAASAFTMVDMATRAGLLAGLLAIGAVVLTCMIPKSARGESRNRRHRARLRPVQVVALLLGCSVAVAALAFTTTGSRLISGITDTSSGAYGTVAARQTVWDRVGDYVLRDAGRTAVGVGFGRNFIAESGSQVALEGTTYLNVRSPHNYVLGTLARLGVAGALIVSMVIGLGWWLGMSRLRKDVGPVGTLAALLALSLPVIALLGVVLESPFGAIPYFWALGHLAALDISSPLEAHRKRASE